MFEDRELSWLISFGSVILAGIVILGLKRWPRLMWIGALFMLGAALLLGLNFLLWDVDPLPPMFESVIDAYMVLFFAFLVVASLYIGVMSTRE